MRKKNRGRKFSRKTDQRKALLKSLARNIILKERIKTTEAKAKAAKILVEKSITRAKENNLQNVKLLSQIFNKDVVKKLIQEIGPRYKERKGGYSRVIKTGPRKSDGAKMAIIELIK